MAIENNISKNICIIKLIRFATYSDNFTKKVVGYHFSKCDDFSLLKELVDYFTFMNLTTFFLQKK